MLRRMGPAPTATGAARNFPAAPGAAWPATVLAENCQGASREIVQPAPDFA